MNPIAFPEFVSGTNAISKKGSSFLRSLVFAIVFLFTPFRLSADWVSVGPAPAINAQCEGITSPEGDNPVAGAIHAVAPSATDANVVYVAAVNGGAWRTNNAKAASPNWTPLTDQALPSLSLSSIAISPLNPQVIFVGSGRVSALSGTGGKEFGIARSANGGTSWTLVGPNLANQTIRRVIPTATLENGNQVVLVGAAAGVFRSADGGTTYTAVTNGIPAGSISDIVGDPGVPTRFYAATAGTIYLSNDTGATWAVATGNGFNVVANARVLLSVHNSQGNDVVYAFVTDLPGTLVNVYRSPDQGANWNPLGVPVPPLFPGTQGDIHGAILADRTDPNTVWVSGDRQPDNTEIGGGPDQWPNPNGANNYVANVFRNVAGAWQVMTNNGANGSSPHADSRSMAFDADGNILHTCDGGIYKLNDPNLPSRRWSSLNSDIKVTEAHSMTYDPLSKNFLCGTQDNGVSFQRATGNFVWNQATQGDGGRVAADADQTAHAGTSLRYFSPQNFFPFRRGTYDATGVQTTEAGPGLMIMAGAGTGMTLRAFDGPGLQFIQPFVLNIINPARMLIGTSNIYESLDNGDTLNNLGAAGAVVGNGSQSGSLPLTYGSRLNGTAFPDVFYVGAGNTILHRVTAGSALTTLTYPGGIVRGIVMDPQNYRRVFVLDNANKVYGSADEGATWTDLTGNLATLTDSVRAIELSNRDAGFQGAVLYAGGAGGGVWQLSNPAVAGTWTVVAAGMPNVLVYGLRYDYTDSILAATTLGRGVFRISGTNTVGAVANVSTRLPVGTGENVLIEGFIVQGPAGSTKKIIVRALGPSLIPFGITDALANPTLEIRDANNASVATNNDWRTTQVGGLITGDQVAEITASALPPTNDLESAIIASLVPGSYTAVVRGVGDTIGTGVVDAFDLSAASPAKLANIATRGFIQPGDRLMIAGFIIQNGPVRALIRAVGPSLAAFGVANALPDTTLQLRDQNGAIVLENDDWRATQEQELITTGLQPTDNLEAALVTTMQPGSYTAQVRGKNNASGVGVVQVYFLQ